MDEIKHHPNFLVYPTSLKKIIKKKTLKRVSSDFITNRMATIKRTRKRREPPEWQGLLALCQSKWTD